ncbi:MAG: helix-turn-helix domain-containing protein [Chloroflexi bacterium]|nr:helix-turn-helix domain-containing protein [Chloroflexota bacterium]
MAQPGQAVRRARRIARWDEVRQLHADGYSIHRIARELKMSRPTIRRLLATSIAPRNRPAERPRPSGLTSPTLQPFADYLQGRWQAGCTNVAQLERELRAQGYQGSYSLLMQAIQPWRGLRAPLESDQAVVGVGAASSGSTCVGYASVHRINSMRSNATHSKIFSTTINRWLVDMDCCSVSVA